MANFLYTILPVSPLETAVVVVLWFQLGLVIIAYTRVACLRAFGAPRLSGVWSVRLLSWLPIGAFRNPLIALCLRDHVLISRYVAGWLLSGAVWVLTIASALIPTSPGMVTLMGFSMPPMTDNFALIFNLTVALFLGAFNQMASWQLSSRSQKPLVKVVEATNSRGLTQNIYIPMALDSAAHVAAGIASAISLGGHSDGRDGQDLRDKVGGIYDNPCSLLAIQKEESHIQTLNQALESISLAFFRINKWYNDDEYVLQTLFLSILEDTVLPLMQKTGSLAVIGGGPVGYPMVFAERIWWKALAVARSRASPAATCLMSLNDFYSVYAPRLKEEKAEDWKPDRAGVSKPRRIFILPDDKWKGCLVEDLVNLEFGGAAKEDMPEAPQDNTTGQWQKGAKITFFAWAVEIHKALGWDVRFLDREKAEKELRADCSGLQHIDFLIVPVGQRQLLFSADIDAIDLDIKDLGGLPVRLCPITVSYGKENYIKFYDRLWGIAKHGSDLLAEEFPAQETVRALSNALNG